jgi:hypothetical protein
VESNLATFYLLSCNGAAARRTGVQLSREVGIGRPGHSHSAVLSRLSTCPPASRGLFLARPFVHLRCDDCDRFQVAPTDRQMSPLNADDVRPAVSPAGNLLHRVADCATAARHVYYVRRRVQQTTFRLCT